jgi:hypothetical protein
MPHRMPVDLGSFPARGACTDAERRAAVALHDDLRADGHEAWVETHWVRPQWAGSLLVHAVIGIAASLVSTDEDLTVPALVAAAIALLSYLLELFDGGGLSRLFYRRATQVVVVEPADPEAIALLVTATMDAPRRAVLARHRRLLPWVAVALALVVAACAARVAGAEGNVVGALQFVPTLVLLIAAAGAVDVATSDWADGDPDAVDRAVAIYEELAARPPDRLSPGLWLAGAGTLGMRAHLRAEKRRAQDTVVLELAGGDEPTWWHSRHPQIRIAAESVTDPAAIAGRALGAEAAARRAGLPAAAVGGAEALDYAVALVDALDAELSASV